MMFDKALFLSLCERYNVEISATAASPMIRDGMDARSITDNDVNRVFSPCQAYFDYSSNRVNTITAPVFNMQEDYAIAC